MRIAMISYNTFLAEEHNGWKHNGSNSVLLLQNADGRKWGASQTARKTHKEWYQETKAIVAPLWEQLKSELPTIDKVVFYVGSHGAERVIELAAEHGLTPDRAAFLLCGCNTPRKIEMIRSRGFSSSMSMVCECGGHDTMRRLYYDVLCHGSLSN